MQICTAHTPILTYLDAYLILNSAYMQTKGMYCTMEHLAPRNAQWCFKPNSADDLCRFHVRVLFHCPATHKSSLVQVARVWPKYSTATWHFASAKSGCRLALGAKMSTLEVSTTYSLVVGQKGFPWDSHNYLMGYPTASAICLLSSWFTCSS